MAYSLDEKMLFASSSRRADTILVFCLIEMELCVGGWSELQPAL
jgi:hypothetical protein